MKIIRKKSLFLEILPKTFQRYSSFAPNTFEVATTHVQFYESWCIQKRRHLQCSQWIMRETQLVQTLGTVEHSRLQNRYDIIGEI